MTVKLLHLECDEPDLEEWEGLVESIDACKGKVTIAVVGKYVQLLEAYLSVWEALKHSALAVRRELEIGWLSSEDFQDPEMDPGRALGLRRPPDPGRLRGPGRRGHGAGGALGSRATGCPTSASAWDCRPRSSSSRGRCASWTGADSAEWTPDGDHPVV
jgi:hypothetical protein